MERLHQEMTFHERKLRNLLRAAFRDEGKAWAAWSRLVERKGLKRALRSMQERPARFGRLQGAALFGFVKTRAFEDREQALRAVPFSAERWGEAQLQVKQEEGRARDTAQQQPQTERAAVTRPAPDHTHQRGR
jgi:hypothetical protein